MKRCHVLVLLSAVACCALPAVRAQDALEVDGLQTLPADIHVDVSLTRDRAAVYNNAYEGSQYWYAIGAGQRIADDCTLSAGSGRLVTELTSQIYNNTSAAIPVTLELWDACPFDNGTLIAASDPTSVGVGLHTLRWCLDFVAVPDTVWVAWSAPAAGIGPLISETAEIGTTEDLFASQACVGVGTTCACTLTNPVLYAGLDVMIFASPAEVMLPGDANCDGVVDFFDIDPFVAALTGEAAWYEFYRDTHGGSCPPCGYLSNDANSDGAVDFFDIDPFVVLLVG